MRPFVAKVVKFEYANGNIHYKIKRRFLRFFWKYMNDPTKSYSIDMSGGVHTEPYIFKTAKEAQEQIDGLKRGREYHKMLNSPKVTEVSSRGEKLDDILGYESEK